MQNVFDSYKTWWFSNHKVHPVLYSFLLYFRRIMTSEPNNYSLPFIILIYIMLFLNLPNFASHLRTIKSWHLEVSEYYSDLQKVHFKECNSFFSVVGCNNFEILLLQGLLIKCHFHDIWHHALNHPIIVDNQDFKFLRLILCCRSTPTTEIRSIFIESILLNEQFRLD